MQLANTYTDFCDTKMLVRKGKIKGIGGNYLKLYLLMQRYRKQRGEDEVYDFKKALKNKTIVRLLERIAADGIYESVDVFFDKREGSVNLAKLLYALKLKIERNYLRTESYRNKKDLKNHRPESIGFTRVKDVFGNIMGKRGYNSFGEEVRCLVLAGENLKTINGGSVEITTYRLRS